MDDLRRRDGEAAAHFTEGEELTVTTTDAYIHQVLERIPQHLPLHGHVSQELRNLFAERLSQGQSVEDTTRQLGDPNTLADSYLAAVPLVPATFMSRVAAKLIDIGLCIAVMIPLTIFSLGVLFIVFLFFGSLIFWLVSAWAESSFGRTPGKKLMGLYVVRESGARISFGQGVVRQLPALLQIFVIDALFALFTERKQRAFELLSRTRTVRETLG
jgi:uncharacterized RDD family membrane protein YckC